MAEVRVERRLAAILAADVVGYSRLMASEEEGTLVALKALRKSVVDPKIAEHRGRIVKTTGDGILVEFASTVDAVRCAIDIQREMPARNADRPPDKKIEFRGGINVGDIIVDGEDIFDDGVNIAARLEGMSNAGGICVSEVVHQQANGRLQAAFIDLGNQTLKNIASPIRVYKIAMAPGTAPSPEAARPTLALPDKPSIAVLAFENMSGAPEQDYFADGMVDDIITGLSRIKWLFVIARNSSFTYKGKAVDVRQVGRELGVRYVLEGGVRKAGNRLRITSQLVEAETGAHLWADKFDGALEDVFDLQDQITDRVVGIVEPSVRRSEVERSRRKHPENLGAYDLYLRALPYMASVMPSDARIAAGFLDQALKLDPNYIAVRAFRAWCHEICFTTEPGFVEAERLAGIQHARAVVASSTDDATALAIAALPMLHLARDHEAAISTIERALSLNASCATALYMGAHIHAFRGNPTIATAHAERALRLSPFDPLLYEAHLALALASLQADRYDEAAARLAKAVQANSGFSTLYFFNAMVLGLVGRAEEAAPLVCRGLELEPGFRSRVIYEFGIVPAILDKLAAGARNLGLPE